MRRHIKLAYCDEQQYRLERKDCFPIVGMIAILAYLVYSLWLK